MFCPRCGTRIEDAGPACVLCGAALPGREGSPAAPSHAVGSHAPWVATVTVPAYAGFWRRLGGSLLDALVIFFPVAIIRVAMGLSAVSFEDDYDTTGLIAMAIEVVLSWLYAVTQLGSPASATLGMRVVGIRLLTVHGDRPSFARVNGRYLAQALSVITLGIGYLMMLFGRRRQTLHDLVSGTVVVRVADEPAVSRPAPTLP